jgi:putative transposase
LIEVDPRNTSQDCSGCGAKVPKELGDRQHECPHCGLSIDRDLNAARNILHRAGVSAGLRNVAGCGMRAGGNLSKPTASRQETLEPN